VSTQLDYTMILADLEAKRAAIETAISSVRAAMALGMLNVSGEIPAGLTSGLSATQVVPSITGNDIPDGAFLGKGIPEGTKLLLEIVKRKLTTREIADALQRGGIESTSSNFIGIVHAVLNRARRTPNTAIVKLGSHWGLKDWYPKGIISAAAPATAKKKKKKAATKSAQGSGSNPSSEPQAKKPQLVRSKIKPGILIAHFLSTNPGKEFSAEELATRFSMNTKVAQMVLGKLISQGKVEKTSTGKYRCPIEHPIAAAQ